MNGFSSGYFADMVFDKPDWHPSDGSVAGDWSASQKTSEALDAVNPDLTAFKGNRGKFPGGVIKLDWARPGLRGAGFAVPGFRGGRRDSRRMRF